MAEVVVSHLVKSFGPNSLAVNDVSFTVGEGEFITLLGPSGCGKTTSLRCIAGLETPDNGEISIAGELFTSGARGLCLPPEKRRLGMVFQSYAVWPHMTVFENVAYGLTAQKTPRVEVTKRVNWALDLVGLGGFGDRNATKLSGGQQQRVSLARALVYNPRVLLFDEPLSNLDAKLRERMRIELASLVRQLHITSVYVTHDQAEAMVMSDRIIVMKDGKIQQEGDPQSIYHHPTNSFVADFIGVANVMQGNVVGHDASGAHWVEIPEMGTRILCGRGIQEAVKPGTKVLVTIRPEYIQVVNGSGSATGDNQLHGSVKEALFLGQIWDCLVQVKDYSLRIQVPSDTALKRDETVAISIPPSRCVLLRD